MKNHILAALFLSSVIHGAYAADEKFSILHHFTQDDPSVANGNLVLDEKKQTLYGHTSRTLFSLDLKNNNQYTPIANSGMYSFEGELTLSKKGDYLYGVKNSFKEGSLFRFNLAEHTITELRHFDLDNDSANGYDLQGGVLLSKDGHYLYGTTISGGDIAPREQGGVLYRVDLSKDKNNFTLLHVFENDDDGGGPKGGLVESPDGAFIYGVTSAVKNGRCGDLFQYNVAKDAFSTLHHFSCGKEAGSYQGGVPSEISLSADGHYAYVTAYEDAERVRKGALFQVDLKGVHHPSQLLYEFDIDSTIYAYPSRAFISHDGNTLFGLTEHGGYDSGTIYSYSLSPKNVNPFNVLYRFEPFQAREPHSTLAINQADNVLYGITEYGGQYGEGVIYKYELGK